MTFNMVRPNNREPRPQTPTNDKLRLLLLLSLPEERQRDTTSGRLGPEKLLSSAFLFASADECRFCIAANICIAALGSFSVRRTGVKR